MNASQRSTGKSSKKQRAVQIVGPFHGAGRRRSAEKSAASKERRADAANIGRMLVEGGIDDDEVYITEDGIVDTMISLDGADRDELGRPRRAWSGYADHAFSLETRAARQYEVFAKESGIKTAVQVVVRPPESTIDNTQFAAWHGRFSKRLTEKIRQTKKHYPKFECDLIAAEIKNVGGRGRRLDAHFHLVIRGVSAAELGDVKEHFEKKGWRFWFDPDRPPHGDPVRLVRYVAKGLAAALHGGNGWSASAIAELRRQTRHLALIRATGAFRTWKASIVADGLIAVEDQDGRAILARRRKTEHRLRTKLSQSAGVTILRMTTHDFGNGLRQRAIRVRGSSGVTLADILARYDLSHLDLIQSNTFTAEKILNKQPTVKEGAHGPPPDTPIDIRCPW